MTRAQPHQSRKRTVGAHSHQARERTGAQSHHGRVRCTPHGNTQCVPSACGIHTRTDCENALVVYMCYVSILSTELSTHRVYEFARMLCTLPTLPSTAYSYPAGSIRRAEDDSTRPFSSAARAFVAGRVFADRASHWAAQTPWPKKRFRQPRCCQLSTISTGTIVAKLTPRLCLALFS